MREDAQMCKRDADDKMRGIRNADNNRYNCSIENFIRDEYSICREERQYAVFLYNILRKYGKGQSREKLAGEEKEDILAILEACGIEADDDIEYVFYEATFMRDFFKRERRYCAVIKNKASLADVLLQRDYEKEEKTKTDFNRRLIEYVFQWAGGDPPEMNMENGDKESGEEDAYLRYNLGRNIPKECRGLEKLEKAEEPETAGNVREKLRAMMNSKPDIAVIYQKNGQRYLLFIECKFESSEGRYDSLSQREVQYHIADFLCGYLNERNCQEYIKVSEKMKSGQSRIVRFKRSDRGGQEPCLPEEGNILIKMLIDYNDKVFDSLDNL